MSILIVKLGAAGDVLRTTPILSLFPEDHVTWVTSDSNLELLTMSESLTPVAWSEREIIRRRKFDLVINLEDDYPSASFVSITRSAQIFGAHLKTDTGLVYTEDSSPWFDMGWISRLGRQSADHLKWINRGSYQEILFSCLGHKFNGEPYLMPGTIGNLIEGDVALCPNAGKTWPMKDWSGYSDVRDRLKDQGYVVNALPERMSVRNHAADITGHRCLLSGDSLPMHLAIGYNIPSVTLFTCTSPWEIYDYGLQTKIVSTRLQEFFYSRVKFKECPGAIEPESVVAAVCNRIQEKILC